MGEKDTGTQTLYMMDSNGQKYELGGLQEQNNRILIHGDSDEAAEYKKRLLSHEIVHAFLNESGLQHCSSVPMGAWARHEEMVDWIAIQFPKIMKAFQEVGAL